MEKIDNIMNSFPNVVYHSVMGNDIKKISKYDAMLLPKKIMQITVDCNVIIDALPKN